MTKKVIAVEGDLTIANINDVKGRILEKSKAGDDLAIDLEQLGEIDIAGIQLLLAARIRAKEAEGAFVLLHPPRKFPENMRKLGIDTSLFFQQEEMAAG